MSVSGAKASVKKLEVIDGGGSFLKSQYDVLFENANDAIIVVNLGTHEVIDANQAALELTGYLRDELVHGKIDILFPVGGARHGQSPSMQHVHIESNGFFEDIVLQAKDGYPRFVSMSAKTVALRGGKVAMCILRDVAEKKKMERDLITKHSELRQAYISLEKANAELKSMQETLVQSGKLAALGELAAGIAHELNQPLTAIMGFAHEASAVLKSKGPLEHVGNYLDEVVQGADKMEKIISHLRNFTRKSTEDFQWLDVHGVIEESLVMLGKQLKSRGIEVERKFDSSLPKIYGNPFQLEQVFINLATNARDAIEAKKERDGRISIATRSSADGKFIEIVFADNGCGLAEGTKGKIFNPFFTTKEVGKGMGLGLSISYGILSRINASILVESALGKGTEFTIKLPVDYRAH